MDLARIGPGDRKQTIYQPCELVRLFQHAADHIPVSSGAVNSSAARPRPRCASRPAAFSIHAKRRR